MLSHSFGDLLRQYRARKATLSQTRLAELAGYDKAILSRMSRGMKDLIGPSGRERVVRLISVLRDEGVLTALDEANALLAAAHLSPLYANQPDEAALIQKLRMNHRPTTAHTAQDTFPIQHNLPAQLTRFIGREREVTEILQLVGAHRLVTLTGSGGVGKTRLVIEVGASFVPLSMPYPDGVWLVELAPITDPALVADTVALALGLHASTRLAQAMLTDHLRDKKLMLLLDNCEHLVGACAELVEALLRACPRLRILVTSREGLNITGETRWRVPPLVTDEAVQLFVEHARAAQPGFNLTEHNARLIERLCERLDGIPLAIELAAARLDAFSVEQIAARLDDRFHLLMGGSRTALPRHQTLRAMIDWSYDLLPQAERVLLRQLSVFAGGWTLEAAEAVNGSADALDLLAQLVSKSLVVADMEVDETTDRTRYHLLETIRQYAHDKLAHAAAGEYEAAYQRHLAYFAGLVHTASTHWFKSAPKPWFDRLETELDNVRTALDWIAHNQDVPSGAQLIGWIFEFWHNRGYAVEGRRWIDTILPPSATMSDSTRMNRLHWLGALAARNCDYAQTSDMCVEAAALAYHIEDERLIFSAYWLLSYVTKGDAAAAQLLNEALRLAQQNRWKAEEAQIMCHLGRRMCMSGNYQNAIQQLEASARAYCELDSPYFLAYSLGQLGMVALAQGDYVQARTQFEASIALAPQSGDTVGTAEWLAEFSTVAVYQGDYVPATAALKEAITTYYNMGNLYRVAQCLAIAAHMAQDCGQPERAARLLAVAGTIWGDFPAEFMWVEPELHREYERCLPMARAALDKGSFGAAWAEGQQMTIVQAIGVALASEYKVYESSAR